METKNQENVDGRNTNNLMSRIKSSIRSERLRIAKDPSTPAEVLAVLAGDNSWFVRSCVVENPNTPVETLTEFAGGEDSYFRCHAVVHSNASADVFAAFLTHIRNEDHWVREVVAKNRNTPAEVLVALAKDKSSDVRSHVARNPNTPVEVLVALAEQEFAVRYAVDPYSH